MTENESVPNNVMFDWLIELGLTSLSAVFQPYRGSQF